MKVNPNIKNLIPYDSSQIDVPIKLNANETKNYLLPEGFTLQYDFERYPTSTVKTLRAKIAQNYNVSSDNVLVGNGSTELLEYITKTFTEPSDTALSIHPSFAMYDIYTKMYGVTLEKVSVDDFGQLQVKKFINAINDKKPDIIYLCNPNNPTGNIISKEDVLSVVSSTNGIVIVDEAYMEFAEEQESVIQEINNYNNLIVARTFSKAYGLASARLGYVIASKERIIDIKKAQLPYSLNEATAQLGLYALSKEKDMRQFVKEIITMREYVLKEIQALPIKVYPSYTNFIYIKTDINIQDALLQRGILIRSFHNNTYRITVGNSAENMALIQALKEVFQ